jgi:hypothetical protein
MAVTDFANHAAAVAAGYVRVQGDRGAGKSPRYFSRYEKPVPGPSGAYDVLAKAHGESDVDQTTADTNALTVLNAQRRFHYSGSPGRASGSAESNHPRGNTYTVDL